MTTLENRTTANGLDFSWKTSVGATIAGIVCSAVVNRTLEWAAVTAPTVSVYLWSSFATVLFMLITLHYAGDVYPSLFTENPKLSSALLISFLNGLLGGVIFGCLWNTCLTKGKKGVSHIVMSVLCVMGICYYLYDGYLIYTMV